MSDISAAMAQQYQTTTQISYAQPLASSGATGTFTSQEWLQKVPTTAAQPNSGYLSGQSINIYELWDSTAPPIQQPLNPWPIQPAVPVPMPTPAPEPVKEELPVKVKPVKQDPPRKRGALIIPL